MAVTFAQLQAEAAAILGIDNTDEATNAARYTKAGLRAIGRAGAWEWLHAAATPVTLTTATYAYALESDLFRIDTKSIRTGGRETRLAWRTQKWIDEYLGPDWRDSGASTGSPEYTTRVGNYLWLAKAPDATYATKTLKYMYWRSEPASGTLYLPDEYIDVAVQAALAYGYLAEDDSRADNQMAKWNNIFLPEMRGAKLNMNDGDQMNEPSWMLSTEDSVDIGPGYSY